MEEVQSKAVCSANSEGHSRPSSSAKMASERLFRVDLQDIHKDGRLEIDEPEIKISLA
jgi:hypothetical protein